MFTTSLKGNVPGKTFEPRKMTQGLVVLDVASIDITTNVVDVVIVDGMFKYHDILVFYRLGFNVHTCASGGVKR
jgi:hypothetical protein